MIIPLITFVKVSFYLSSKNFSIHHKNYYYFLIVKIFMFNHFILKHFMHSYLFCSVVTPKNFHTHNQTYTKYKSLCDPVPKHQIVATKVHKILMKLLNALLKGFFCVLCFYTSSAWVIISCFMHGITKFSWFSVFKSLIVVVIHGYITASGIVLWRTTYTIYDDICR